MSFYPEPDVERQVQGEVARLADDFQGLFGLETIERCAHDSLHRLGNTKVKHYLPSLVYRFTRERLKATVEARGETVHSHPEILFICARNAGRSQMAAALTFFLAGKGMTIHAAGSDPAEQLDPVVVEAMAEVGLDLSSEFPKPLTDEVVGAADIIVTMGCGDACPVYYGKTYRDWPIADPAEQPIETVRRIRDEIREQVKSLLAELEIPLWNRVGSNKPPNGWSKD